MIPFASNEYLDSLPESTTIRARYAYPLVPTDENLVICHAARTSLMNDLTLSLMDVDAAQVSLFMPYSIAVLVDYLQRSHRHYMVKALPEIGLTLADAIRRTPDEIWFSRYAMPLFQRFVADTELHFTYEETYLFPYALALNDSSASPRQVSKRMMFSADIFVETHPHSDIDLSKVISLLSRKADEFKDNMAYRVLLQRLQHIENDMRLHSFIEDEVLVGKLRKREREL